jgi:hypothetical protein
MIKTFDQWLEQPGSAERLALSRILFYGCFLVQVFLYDASSYATLPAELWRPTLLLALFPAPSEALFLGALHLLEIAMLLACVGISTRISCIAVAVLGTYVFGAINGYGHADFHLSPLLLISWVMALAPSGDAYSLDAWLHRPAVAKGRSDYYWPIKLAQVCLVALMGTAGALKAYGMWLSDPAGAMRSFLLYKYYAQSTEKAISLPTSVLVLADWTWVLILLGILVLTCELGCAVALSDRWLWVRIVIIGNLFLMQLVLAVWLKTLPTFPWLAAYVFWVPWERVFLRRGSAAVGLTYCSR